MRKILIVIVYIHSIQLLKDPFTQIVVWNVGQGQWITIRDENSCLNIDTGGDRFPSAYPALCPTHNLTVFTHADRDHINFFQRSNSKVFLHPRIVKNKISLRLMDYPPVNSRGLPLRLSIFTINNSSEKTMTNGYSRAFSVFGLVVPGDINAKGEALLLDQMRYADTKNVRWLVASHHGSRHGQSHLLLKTLKPTQVIVSALKRRYGHPHIESLKRWKKNGIPALSTEDWGNIRIIAYR